MTIRELIRPAGLAGLVLALPMIAPSDAAAQTMMQSVEPKVLYACYVPGSGTVYRIKEPGTPTVCGKSGQTLHIEFSWTDGAGGGSGEAGPMGPEGPQGEKGDKGDKGDQGEPGADGVTAHDMLTGLDADDHLQYLLTTGTRQSGGFAVTGGYGAGSLPVTGGGIRMMWHPAKAAFRVGHVMFDGWDDQNVGTNSIALGLNPIASGNNSIALHHGKAKGSNSFAWGIDAEAEENNALALGPMARAISENSLATAWGTARGTGAIALLYGEAFANATLAWRGRAAGTGALALGPGTVASGENSIVIGSTSVAGAQNAMSLGTQTTATGQRSTAMGTRVSTNGRQGAFIYGDFSTLVDANNSRDNQFAVRAQHFWFGSNNSVTHTAGRFIETSTGAYLSQGGTWTNSSDVNVKHNFEVVDTEQVLRKVAALPITTWSYRTENADVRHMGPMAQDFRAAFGLGDTDKAIATVDVDGVALAAIKALDARSRAQDARIAELEATVAALLNALGQK